MAMTKTFEKTPKQIEQVRLFKSGAKHCMSYGGSRSGKTFGICRAMAIRAAKTTSRHVALRLKFNHAKTSLWYETFPKVFDKCFPDIYIRPNKQDYFYSFPNGSEIWIGGLDEKERAEKILGKEYSTIFFNECSQIPYTSVNLALTRLAEQNDLAKKVYYDENPPTKRHWSYPLFIEGKDPDTWEPKADAHNYGSILMNPVDNLANIDDDYLNLLKNLPERERARFLDGQFLDDTNGNIYYAFSRERNVRPLKRLENFSLVFGMDFNVSPMTAVVCQIVDGTIYVIDEFWLLNSNTFEMGRTIQGSQYKGRWNLIPDSTGKAMKTSAAGLSDHQILRDLGFNVPFVQNPFRMDRYNAVNDMLEKGRIVIDPKCVKLIADLEKVVFKEGTNLPDEKDKLLTHISDALGYLVHWAFPIVRYSSGVYSIPR